MLVLSDSEKNLIWFTSWIDFFISIWFSGLSWINSDADRTIIDYYKYVKLKHQMQTNVTRVKRNKASVIWAPQEINTCQWLKCQHCHGLRISCKLLNSDVRIQKFWPVCGFFPKIDKDNWVNQNFHFLSKWIVNWTALVCCASCQCDCRDYFAVVARALHVSLLLYVVI